MPPVGSAAAIYDIARVAGANPSTVSRDLNKPGRVSVKTEERIHAAAKALSYRLNPMALALPTGRTSTLGLLLADITNPMFFELVRGAERIAPSVDGLILVATRLTDEQIRSLAQHNPAPGPDPG
jgi:LacI family transcriptional regulator